MSFPVPSFSSSHGNGNTHPSPCLPSHRCLSRSSGRVKLSKSVLIIRTGTHLRACVWCVYVCVFSSVLTQMLKGLSLLCCLPVSLPHTHAHMNCPPGWFCLFVFNQVCALLPFWQCEECVPISLSITSLPVFTHTVYWFILISFSSPSFSFSLGGNWKQAAIVHMCVCGCVRSVHAVLCVSLVVSSCGHCCNAAQIKD